MSHLLFRTINSCTIYLAKESKIRTIHRKMKSSDFVDLAAPDRLELTTLRLTAECSTD